MNNRLTLFLSLLLIAVAVASLQSRKGDTFAVGEKIMGKLNDDWVPAVVLKKEDDQYYVHFEGRGEADDQWVSVYRMEKLSRFGTDFKTGKKNTREYKVRAEAEYFCKKNVRRGGGRVPACVRAKIAQSKQKQRPDLAPWNWNDPGSFDIHQACMGDRTRFCADKCGFHRESFCLPQCLEQVEKCRCTYEYDMAIAKACKGADWNKESYAKGGKWALPTVTIDDRKNPLLYGCLAPHAKVLDRCNECASLERCNAVCQVDPDSQKAGNVTGCKKKCRGWFPKCRNPVAYTY